MYQKFIINQDGVLKFGRVYLHRDLLSQGEECPYGGGLWKIDEGRGAILLYGRSFDFGAPDFVDSGRCGMTLWQTLKILNASGLINHYENYFCKHPS